MARSWIIHVFHYDIKTWAWTYNLHELNCDQLYVEAGAENGRNEHTTHEYTSANANIYRYTYINNVWFSSFVIKTILQNERI